MKKKTTKLLVVAFFCSMLVTPKLAAQTYLDFLTETMDKYHSVFYVYEDASSAGNHFDYKGALGDFNSGMDANWATSPQSGKTCIKATYNAGSNPGWNGWTGWSMQNGVLLDGTAVPVSNWGTYPNAGVDLSGATTLSFWAKGESGGEVVEFSAFGIGRDFWGNPNQPYPGSSAAIKTEITLTSTWTEYTLDLTGKDLSYILGGFTWAAAASKNGNQNIVFYIDNIQYDHSRLDEPRFLTSFKTIPSNEDFDLVMGNVAYSYDNALALMSFLIYGDTTRARLIADAFVYAYHNDRFYDGTNNNDGNPFNDDKTLRNAYQSGDLTVPNGWIANGKSSTVRMSGWWDPNANGGNGAWYEDLFAASTHTGNVAWPMLALLSYYQTVNGDNYVAGDPYLEVIEGLGEWIENHTKDANGSGGYIGGLMGWSEWGADPFSSGLPAGPKPLTYKSTEQNLDLFACFQRMENIYNTTGGSTGKSGYTGYWQTRADYTKNFVLAMWNATDKHFWTGTTGNGITIDTTKVATDAQTWTILALKLDSSYWAAMDFAEINNMYYLNGQPTWGFDFNDKNQFPWYPDAPADYTGETDGIWFEGTGQAANAYQFIQQEQKAADVYSTIVTLGQTASGGVNAVYTDLQNGTWEILTSGFESLIASGSSSGIDAIPWYYYKREHVGATAWAVSSEQRINLFWLGTPDGNIPLVPGSSGQSDVTSNSVTHNWYNVTMNSGFSEAPVLVAGMQTCDGGDPAGIRIKNLTSSSFKVMVEEEKSKDSEISHTTEVIGYIAFEEGLLKNDSGFIIGEARKVTNNQANGSAWYTINLANSYTSPVVLMEMSTFNGGDPTHIRLKNVSSGSFQYQMEEWDYKDGAHTTENMSYIVVESGTHTFSNGAKLVAGQVNTNQSFTTKNYGTTLIGTPVVISQSQTYNDASAIVTRQINIGTTSFKVRVQEEEGNDGSHATETIGFFAIESGSVAGRLASSPQVEKPESLEEVLEENEFGINIYPNPANNLLNIDIGLQNGEKVVIEVYDMSGSRVYFSTPNTLGKKSLNFAINTSNFKTGLYSLRVVTGSNILSKIVVVTR